MKRQPAGAGGIAHRITVHVRLSVRPARLDGCPLAFDWSREDEGVRTIDLSEFRERVKAQGFALSLKQPFAPASPADGTDGAQAPPVSEDAGTRRTPRRPGMGPRASGPA